jgi:hypothetical protein
MTDEALRHSGRAYAEITELDTSRQALTTNDELCDDDTLDELLARWNRAGRPRGTFSHDPSVHPWVGDCMSSHEVGQDEPCDLYRVEEVTHDPAGGTTVSYVLIHIGPRASIRQTECSAELEEWRALAAPLLVSRVSKPTPSVIPEGPVSFRLGPTASHALLGDDATLRWYDGWFRRVGRATFETRHRCVLEKVLQDLRSVRAPANQRRACLRAARTVAAALEEVERRVRRNTVVMPCGCVRVDEREGRATRRVGA